MAIRSSSKSSIEESIVLITGKEEGAKQAEAERRVKAVVHPDFFAFDRTVLDGRSTNAREIWSAVRTSPLASSKRAVVVWRVNALEAREQDQLAQFLEETFPSSTLLVLVTLEDDSLRGGVSAKLMACIREQGKILTLDPPRPREAVQWALEQARERYLRMDYPTAQALVARVGSEPSLLKGELDKVALYLGERGEVTPALVEELVCASAEHRVWELTEALGQRDAKTAFKVLNHLLSAGETPHALIPLISAQLRRIWQMKARLEGKKLAEKSALEDFPLHRLADFQLQKLENQAKRFTWSELESALETLLTAELLLKGVEEGPDNPRQVLEMVLFRLCGCGGSLSLGQGLVIEMH